MPCSAATSMNFLCIYMLWRNTNIYFLDDIFIPTFVIIWSFFIKIILIARTFKWYFTRSWSIEGSLGDAFGLLRRHAYAINLLFEELSLLSFPSNGLLKFWNDPHFNFFKLLDLSLILLKFFEFFFFLNIW